jgi:hypothetical protein
MQPPPPHHHQRGILGEARERCDLCVNRWGGNERCRHQPEHRAKGFSFGTPTVKLWDAYRHRLSENWSLTWAPGSITWTKEVCGWLD